MSLKATCRSYAIPWDRRVEDSPLTTDTHFSLQPSPSHPPHLKNNWPHTRYRLYCHGSQTFLQSCAKPQLLFWRPGRRDVTYISLSLSSPSSSSWSSPSVPWAERSSFPGAAETWEHWSISHYAHAAQERSGHRVIMMELYESHVVPGVFGWALVPNLRKKRKLMTRARMGRHLRGK